MIVASWNIRGFNKPLKHLRMQRLLRDSKIDVIALLETKLSRHKARWIFYRKFQG